MAPNQSWFYPTDLEFLEKAQYTHVLKYKMNRYYALGTNARLYLCEAPIHLILLCNAPLIVEKGAMVDNDLSVNLFEVLILIICTKANYLSCSKWVWFTPTANVWLSFHRTRNRYGVVVAVCSCAGRYHNPDVGSNTLLREMLSMLVLVSLISAREQQNPPSTHTHSHKKKKIK